MFSNKNKDLSVNCGDSMGIFITPLNDDETPYFLGEGEYVRFFVRILPGHEPVIEKTLTAQAEDGTLYAWLSPEDTNISRSSYIYEAKLYSPDESEITAFIGGGKEKPRFIVS